MKIAIAMVQVPFITGGAEIHAIMLKEQLIKRGHQADIVTIPFKWYPPQTLKDCMLMARMMDLTEINGEKIDVVIAMKFPAIYVKHPNKVLWLLHQHRQAYDLWETPYGDIHNLPNGQGDELRDFIIACDNRYIQEAKAIYTNAQNTSNRLLKFNGIKSNPLYHPPQNHHKLRCDDYGDFLFYPSRITPMKRQRLLVEAAKYVKTPVKFVLAGGGAEDELDYLQCEIKKNKLENKVKLAGFVSEEEKINYYANCLGVYFGAFDEDYGYITLEGFFSKKPVIVHKDSGGPLEFVVDNQNGFILDSDARLIAEKADALYNDRKLAQRLGEAGFDTLKQKKMDWDYVINSLLSTCKR